MDVRGATAADRSAIREIARESLRASYSLSPEQLDGLLDSVFADDALGDRVEAADTAILVATDDGRPVGFVEVALGEVATLRWLHVRSEERGRGIATSLVEAARRDFTSPDRSLEARVLEAASEGGGFLERFGLERADSEEVEIGGEQYHELVYTAGLVRHDANEPLVEVPETVAVDGEDRPLALEEPIPGTTAPFFQLYSDGSREERYGYFCSSCASTAVVADGLDRLECGECGNHHLAEDWDDAYL